MSTDLEDMSVSLLNNQVLSTSSCTMTTSHFKPSIQPVLEWHALF